jgi:hypothetical protein
MANHGYHFKRARRTKSAKYPNFWGIQYKGNERSKNVSQVVHEPNGEVDGIYFQTESQRKLYSKIGTVLDMEGTYGTNNVNFSLYHLMCEDNNGESQPVAQYFTKTYSKGALSDFLRIFTEVFTLYYLT